MLDDKNISERIEECIKQAEAWTILGEKDSVYRILLRVLNLLIK
jgi:hypothetical protein